MAKQQFQTVHFQSEEKAFRRVHLRILSKAARVAVQHPGVDEVIGGLAAINTAMKTVLLELDNFKLGTHESEAEIAPQEEGSGTDGSAPAPEPEAEKEKPAGDSSLSTPSRKKSS